MALLPEGGLLLPQVTGALAKVLEKRNDVYVIYDKELQGVWEFDNQTIKTHFDENKNNKNIKYIVTSYPIDQGHQVSLVIKDPHKNPEMIVTDSLGYDRRKNIAIETLSQALNINQITNGNSNYFNQPNTASSWECGVHTFFNTLDIVNKKVIKKSKLELNQNLENILKYAYAHKIEVEKDQLEKEQNRLEKDKLMVAIEKLRHKKGHFDDKDAQDALRDVADALQLELWGNLDRKAPDSNSERIKDQNDKIRERKIDELIEDYEKSHSEDIMGIIVLNALKSTGNLEEAVTFYENAMKDNKLHFSNSKDIETIDGKLNNLGLVFFHLGKYPQSEEYFAKALKIREEKLGKDHPSTAATYNNIALVYKAQSQYEESLKFYFLALKINEEKLGKDHPDTAATYNNIAGVYKAQGKYKESISLYSKAYEIYKQVFGDEHPTTKIIKSNLDATQLNALQNSEKEEKIEIPIENLLDELGQKLIKAIRQSDFVTAYSLIDNPATNLNATSPHYGWTPLMHAIWIQHEPIILELLTKKHIDINHQTLMEARHFS